MKQEVTKLLQQVSLFFLLFISTVSVTTAQYTLTDDDVVVSGGIIQSCSYDFAITDIIIPATLDGQSVTGVLDRDWGSGVFYNKGITSLVLPASINHIGNFTFRGNPLVSVDLSACIALTTIGDGAFADISSITNMDFSTCTALTSIGSYAFRSNRITSLDLSNNVALINIGGEAFSGNALTEISLPNNLTNIGGGAFTRNQITMVNGSPSDGLIYGRNANATIDYTTISSFGGTSKNIIIPAQIVVIEDDAFKACRLTSIDFSACTALTTIGATAFYSNNLGSLDLSNCTSLTTIKTWAFLSAGLTSLNLSGCAALTTIEDVAFYSNRLTSVDLSGCTSLSYIGRGAFRFNTLTSVDLSDCAALDTVMFNAFRDNSLVEINLPNNITHLGYAVFNDNQITTANGKPFDGIIYARTENATTDSTIIVSYGGVSTNVTIPSQVVVIGRDGFNGNFLTNVDFSACKALSTIGNYAFQNNSLPGIDLSACTALTAIRSWAFLGNQLTEFALPTPDISGFQFNHWSGGGNVYAGGATTNDLYAAYTANLTASYKVTFTITDGVNPIEGANVQLGSNGTVTTNADGIAVFAKVLPANDITYSVSSTKYDDISGTVSVIDSDISKELTLNLTTYDVTFTINSGTEAVAGATVSLSGYGTATSDASGIATFTNVALANDIAYTVSAPNYDDVSGTVSVVNSDVNEEVTLSLTTYNVTFTINSGINAVAGAIVSLSGYGTATSDATGIATFTNVLPANNIAYTVSAPNYDDVSGTVSVVDSDVSEEVTLSLTTYNVTFTINSGTDAVAGATVSLNGYGTATSDASGIATFSNVTLAKDIAYTVSAPNYDDASGTVSVVDSDVSEEVQLAKTTTGFDELGDYSINAYPNPTTDILTITQPAGSPLAKIEVYTTSGLKVKVKDLQNNSEKITLNVHDLVIGSYILKCITRNNHTFTSLIMKK
jgi:hypothetical protein